MLDRLLDRIEPQRRHLGFLVALLVLTFVLTVMLAFNARNAEIARRQQAQAVLRDLLAHSSEQWALQANAGVGTALQNSMYNALRPLIDDPHVPLRELKQLSRPDHFCPECAPRAAASFQFFEIDPVTGSVGAAGESAISATLASEVLRQAWSGGFVQPHQLVGMAVALAEREDGVEAAAHFVRLDEAGYPLRIVGYTLPPEAFGELLGLVFQNLSIVPRGMAMDLPNDTFFSTRALVGSTAVLSSTPDSIFVAVDTVSAPPAHGLVLQVGIRENAATKLLIAGAMSTSLPLLVTLMVAIAGLILLALLLVRREAELVRLRADFVSSVSHELRTPLAQIRMFVETLLLNRTRSDLERRRSLEIIDQEARRLSHMVENVLLFSKSAGGRRPPLSPQPTELAGEVLRAVETFAPLYRARSAEIRPELQEHVTAPIDRAALRQVLVNLLENALKYGPSGQRVTVGLALFDDEARIWVDDEGPGIPEGEREKVFDSFYRLDRDIVGRVSGNGIGLAVVRELARLHGGDARAQDAPGRGARVVVSFPGARLERPAAGLAAVS